MDGLALSLIKREENARLSAQADNTTLLLAKRDKGTKIDPVDVSDALLLMFSPAGTVSQVIGTSSVDPIKTTFLKRSLNLFNLNTITVDSIVSNSNGGVGSFAGYNASDFIPISPNTLYITSNTLQMAFYDSTKTYISGLAGGRTATFTTPSNAYYVRLSFYGSVANSMMSVGGTLPTSYVPHYFYLDKSNTSYPLQIIDTTDVPINSVGIDQLKLNAVSPLKTSFMTQKANLFNKLSALSDYLIGSNGLPNSLTGYYASDWIDVLPSTQYTKSSTLRYAYYDINKTLIGYNGDGTSATFTTPSNCYYIRVSVIAGGLANYMVVAGASIPTSFIPYGFDLNSVYDPQIDTLKQWKNKIWDVVGDSISVITGNYTGLVQANLGLFKIYNDANAGKSTVSYMTGGYLSTSNIALSDLVTIFLGTNDYGGNVALGTITDAIGANTTYGALMWLVQQILTVKPTVKLAFITPLQRGNFTGQPIYPAANGAGFTLDQYVQAVKDVAKMYAIPVCDLFNISGINSYTYSTYLSDGLHPIPDVGMPKIATIISQFLNTI